MSGGILEIGVRSLLAYQSAIQVTTQNLENANTEFYSRQQVNFAEAMFNNGVEISNVERLFDNVANTEFLRTTSVEGRANLFYEKIADLETGLDNDKTNINKFIIDSFQALQDLTNSVGSVQSRSAFMSKLASLSDRFRDVGAELDTRKENLNQSIINTVEQANEYINQVSKISLQMQALPEDQRAQLFDQRNKLVHELSQLVNVNVSTHSDGLLTMTMTNGVTLISGTESNRFVANRDEEDTSKLKIFVDNGASQSDVNPYVTQGQLAALLDYRSKGIEAVENGLNRLSLAMTDTFNNQNKLGMDLNGLLGVDIYNSINSAELTNARVLPNTNNTGSSMMTADINNTNLLTTSDYRISFTSATAFNLTRLSDNAVVGSGSTSSLPATVTADGFTVTMPTGSTFATGDKYLVKPTARASSDMTLHISDPKSLALGFPVSATFNNLTNKGEGRITVTEITDTTNSAFSVVKALTPPLKLQFLSDTSYQLVNADNNSIIEGPIAYDSAPGKNIFPTPGGYDPGYRVFLEKEVKSGDEFNISYNIDTGDNRNVKKFSDLFSAKNVGGNLNYSSAYGLVSNDISLKTSSAEIDKDASLSLMKSSREKYYDYSGVSMPEEATNLAKYQQCYQASAQVIQVAKSLFETIIGIVRG